MWRMVGRHNLAFTTGQEWKKHSKVISAAFLRPPPLAQFAALSRTLFSTIKGQGEIVKWDDMAERITLDVLGTTIMGRNFDAITKPNSPFADGYRRVMTALMAPPYIFLPFLDKYFPRKKVVEEVGELRGKFEDIVKEKSKTPGEDLISRMLEDPEFDDLDVLDNVSVLFVAGHVSPHPYPRLIFSSFIFIFQIKGHNSRSTFFNSLLPSHQPSTPIHSPSRSPLRPQRR